MGTIAPMGWGFVWLMLVLKIPIGLLLWLVWWAIKQTPEEAGQDASGGGGGTKVRHPRTPFPRKPRRGPHGDPQLPAPPRVRTVVARARTPEH
jgi:hypothetical protein